MKKISSTFFLILVLICAQVQTSEAQQTLNSPSEVFVDSFYASHKDVKNLHNFFDKEYFASFYKFTEHMILKNKTYGDFVSKKIIKARNSPDSNMIWRTYRIKYRKGSMIEKLEFSRVSVNEPYKITYWQTER